MKLSLCITTYNRSDLTIESFSKVYNHPMIDEIVIVDDCSDWNKYLELINRISEVDTKGKIRFFRNKVNLGMSRNKAEAISKATNEWVIILDSDNVLYPEYIEAAVGDEQGLEHINNFKTTIYQPSECESEYSFIQFSDLTIDKHNAKDLLHIREFRIMLNQCNYLVNRDEYLKVYRYDPTIQESDTIHFNYLWLAAGNSFYVVPGCKYFHRRHAGSGWLTGNHEYNLKKAAEIQNKIKNL